VKEFLSVKQLDYVEYNVEENPEARHRMISKSRQTVIPTVIVGEEIVTGYDVKKLVDLLS
jgi:glutaredoxin 3